MGPRGESQRLVASGQQFGKMLSVSPPVMLRLKAANIPDELRSRAQWVVWRLELRNGEWSKVPINPRSGKRARANDPSTWSDFARAVSWSINHGGSGVGFVFSADDPFCGIDLDHCRNIETGNIAPWAQTIIDRLESYS